MISFPHLGTGPLDALMNPQRVVAAFSADVVWSMVIWLLPVGLLPLLAGRWFIAIVVAGLPLLLVKEPGPHLPYFHYGSVLAPLVIGAAAAAIGSRFLDVKSGSRIAVAGAGLSLALMSPLSPVSPAQYKSGR